MNKIITKNYIFYGDSAAEDVFIFIPGGPGISGEYWDFYIQENFLSINKLEKAIYRIILPNHENQYGNNNDLNFFETSKLLAQIINELSLPGKTAHVIAHSFGASLCLFALSQKYLSNNLNKIFLIGFITRIDFSDRYQSKRKLMNIKSMVETDEGFINYFHELLPLYLADTNTIFLKEMFINGYYAKNKSMGLTSAILEEIFEFMQYPEMIIINGENDLLMETLNPTEKFKSLKHCIFEKIEKVAHFPMIESPIIFSNVLKKFIRK
jgi:pimeloyl-ACP methyl ester carboxylesterase